MHASPKYTPLSKWLAIALLPAALLASLTGCDQLNLDNLEPPPETTITDDFVDLRPMQTPIRDQGTRTTCIVFSGVAALEAAYRRFGFGEIDMSEQFLAFTRKAFYLHPVWSDMEARGRDGVETQLGNTGGGGGVGVIMMLAEGFRVPAESVMPYKDTADAGYSPDDYPVLNTIRASDTNTQRIYSEFNLDKRILDYDVLHADKFYSVGGYRVIADPKDPAQIERALHHGYEVVWDFEGADPAGEGGYETERGVWQVCDSCRKIAHSMLIVGYDKRDADPAKHYFIVKNSWDRSFTAPHHEEGFTYISYDYLRSYGTAAGYITSIGTTGKWSELPFIGRWNIDIDGDKGQLDIYHLPGMNRAVFLDNYRRGVIDEIPDDYRLGSYYDSAGNAYKVNGHVDGNKIDFYIDSAKPLLKWDELSGRHFILYRDFTNYMAGIATDPSGTTVGVGARKSGYLGDGSLTPRPITYASYLDSTWELVTSIDNGMLTITDNISNPADDFYLMTGSFDSVRADDNTRAVIKIPKDDATMVYLQIEKFSDTGTPFSFIGKHLNGDDGTVVGNTVATDNALPFIMRRQ